MHVLLFTLLISLFFGAVAFWYGVMRRSRLTAYAGRRETFRMAVAVCVSAAFSSTLMLAGVHWAVALVLTGIFVIVMMPLYIRLVRFMEGIDT